VTTCQALDAGGYFTHPIVKVEVSSYASRYVTVLGAVNHPISSRSIAPTACRRSWRGWAASGRRLRLRDLSSKDGPERRITLQEMATGDLHEDPYVSPGDKVYAPEADLVYVSGQVRTPGAFPLKSGMTFRMAISKAGGLTDSGSEKAATLTRDGKKTKHVDLDSKVMPGDTVVIGERLF